MSFDMSTAQEVPASETLNPSSKPKFDMASAVDISSQPPDNWQNVLHQASRSVMESNRQAQAGASEFLRNPMGGSDSYMKGFNNPQGSETFANQFIRQDMEKNPGMMEDKNTIPAFLQTLPSNLIGSQVDMMANPLQAAIGAGIGKYAEPVMGAVGKGASFVGKGIADSPFGKAIGGAWDTAGQIFGSGKDLKNVEGQLASNESQTTGLQGAREVAKDNLSNSALDASESAKGKISSTAKGWSDTYGEGLDQAEEDLANSGTKLKKSDYLKNVVEPSIQQAHEMNLPSDNPTLSKLYQLHSKLSPPTTTEEFVPEMDMMGNYSKPPESAVFDDNLNVKDFRDIKNSVLDSISSGFKKGTASAKPEDVAGNIFLKNHGNYVASVSEDMANMNKEFGPAANSRNWAYKVFKPGKPDEVQRGANVLERIAKGTHNADDLNYLDQLEKGSGRFKGTGNLRGNTQSYADQIKDIDSKLEGLKTDKGNLVQQQSKIQSLKSTRNKLIAGAAGVLGYGASKATSILLKHQ